MENENKNHISLNEILNIPNQNSEDNTSYFLELLKKVQSTSSAVKKMKLVEDHQYFLSQNKAYEQLLNKTSKKIENLIIKMMFFGKKIHNANDLPNIRKNFDSVCDFVDDLLEKTADNIDILKGIRKEKKDEDIENELKEMKKISKVEKTYDQYYNYIDKLCDNTYNYFIPKIKFKHNQLKQLSEEIIKEQRNREENYENYKDIVWKDRACAYNAKIIENPYNYEINSFFIDFSKKCDIINNAFYNFQKDFKLNNTEDHFFQDFLNSNKTIKMEEITSKQEFNEINNFHNFFFNSDYIINFSSNKESLKQIINSSHFLYKDLDSTNYLYIDNYENWKIMLEDLNQANEIAVDLEHHHLESYIGIVCLMQISTRFTDYIVDTIKLREHIQEINLVFTNPNILKVFHGSDFDVMWLQRDFGVYVVNMFDTGQASKILEYQSYGLAYLLSKFCNVTANKVHQKDDWRIRPLTKEMLKYAREDTHYLLYIYDCLKKQLLLKSFNHERPILNFISIVMEKSKDICLKKYFKPEIKDYNYYGLISRNALILSKAQISIFKIIFKFRDYVARKENRSPDYILPNNKIFTLAKLTEWKLQDLLRICDKPPFKNYINELLSLIEEKLTKIGLVKEKKESHVQNYINDVKSKLNKNNTMIIKNNSINTELSSKINIFTKTVLNEKQYTHNFLEDVEKLSNQISVNFQPSRIIKSKLIDEDETINVDKSCINFNNLIQKFENFNLITYLKEKHNLPNLKIAPIKQILTSKKENIVKNDKVLIKDTKLDTLNEKLLGKKRINELDLTSIDPINTNKNEEEEENIENDEEEDKKKDQYIGFEETKNFLASTKFIENILNKNTEIKSFKSFKHNKNDKNTNTKNNNNLKGNDMKSKNNNFKKKN